MKPAFGRLIDNTPFNSTLFNSERRDAARWCFTKRRFQKMLEWHGRWKKAFDLLDVPPGDGEKMNAARLKFLCVLIVRDADLRDLWLDAKRVLREELQDVMWSFNEIDYSTEMDTVQKVCDALNDGRDPLMDSSIPRTIVTDPRGDDAKLPFDEPTTNNAMR